MVLGELVGVEPEPLVRLDQLNAFSDLLRRRPAGRVVVVEDRKAHRCLFQKTWGSGRSHASVRDNALKLLQFRQQRFSRRFGRSPGAPPRAECHYSLAVAADRRRWRARAVVTCAVVAATWAAVAGCGPDSGGRATAPAASPRPSASPPWAE